MHTILQDAAQEPGALPGSAPLPPLLPPGLQAACHRAWVHKAWSCVTVSHFQRELAQALATMGLAPRLEYATEDGLFLVDVAVHKGRLRFAVEADGPQHFSRNAPHAPLGHSSARWALRCGCGEVTGQLAVCMCCCGCVHVLLWLGASRPITG